MTFLFFRTRLIFLRLTTMHVLFTLGPASTVAVVNTEVSQPSRPRCRSAGKGIFAGPPHSFASAKSSDPDPPGDGGLPCVSLADSASHISRRALLIRGDDAREFAYAEKDGAPSKAAQQLGWHVVSMKSDWNKVFAFTK